MWDRTRFKIHERGVFFGSVVSKLDYNLVMLLVISRLIDYSNRQEIGISLQRGLMLSDIEGNRTKEITSAREYLCLIM
jgi:hypothetical protein